MSIVLIGKIGSGKTTLYNKITKSNENVKPGGSSVTMNVFQKNSCAGSGFKVLDTPGFGSDSKKADHVAGVLSALAEGPLHRILIITKFDRTPNIVDEVKRIIAPFLNYRVMITVVVTCWDQCLKQDSEQNKKDIKERLGKYKINSALFVGFEDSAESICNQIDQIIAISQQNQVRLSEDDIFKNFDLAEYDEEEIFEIELQKTDLVEKYHSFYLLALKCIDEVKCPQSVMPDFTYALTKFSKEMVEQLIKQFEEKQKQNIDTLKEVSKLKGFQIHFELKQQLHKDYENIVEHAQKKTHTNSHFARFLKKCNFCNQIWLKVAGCDGGTVCGKLVEGTNEQIDQPAPPSKFEFTYKKEKLEYKQIAMVFKEVDAEKVKQNLQRDEKTKNLIVEMQGVGEKVRVGGVGCKKIIYWTEMINLTEDELTEVMGVMDKSMQEYLIQQDELIRQKAKNQQLQYKEDLMKKIQEQTQILRQKNTK